MPVKMKNHTNETGSTKERRRGDHELSCHPSARYGFVNA
jgi:hypothetical protein